MRELTKSVVSSSWALSLFGAQQLADLMSASRPGRSLAARANSLDAVTGAARASLSNRLQRFYHLNDDGQRGMVDLAGAAIRFDVSGMLKPAMDVANPFVTGVGAISPSRDWLVDWQELRNKIDIYDLVQNVESRIDAHPDVPLNELVSRAYGLGDFHALWAVEGLGHYYAEQAFKSTEDPRGLLSDPAALGLPDKSLTMLNAGIGLAVAERLIEHVKPTDADQSFGDAVARFVDLCHRNATRGYTGCALESLGLVARTFHPRLVAPLDIAIQATGNEDLLGYFWHGAGRANYFALRNFLPCCGISWARLVEQSPHHTGKRNLVAGLAWAITLVNMRTPQVMEKLLRRRGREITNVDAEAFGNGITSSSAVRQDTTPCAAFIWDFCHAHRIGFATSNVADAWERWVVQPCHLGSTRLHAELASAGRLEVLFAFRVGVGLERLASDSMVPPSRRRCAMA
jgi:hypothetical protein